MLLGVRSMHEMKFKAGRMLDAELLTPSLLPLRLIAKRWMNSCHFEVGVRSPVKSLNGDDNKAARGENAHTGMFRHPLRTSTRIYRPIVESPKGRDLCGFELKGRESPEVASLTDSPDQTLLGRF